MPGFGVRFDYGNAGWLNVRLSNGTKQWAWYVSAVLYDSFSELTTSLISLLSTPHITTSCRWNMEPEELDFSFERNGADAQLTVYAYPDMRRSRELQTVVAEIRGTPHELVIPFWRALRRLETTPSQLTSWPYPFPTNQLQHLTHAIHVEDASK